MIFQGDRTEKVGVIDSEYVVHQGIPSLGGPSLSSKVLLATNFFFKKKEIWWSPVGTKDSVLIPARASILPCVFLLP